MEDLDIEREAVDSRRGEDQAGHIRPKCLQPTLRIPVLTEQQRVGREIDEPPPDLPDTPGADQRGRCDVTAVADDDIPTALDLSEERDDLGGCVCEVRV